MDPMGISILYKILSLYMYPQKSWEKIVYRFNWLYQLTQYIKNEWRIMAVLATSFGAPAQHTLSHKTLQNWKEQKIYRARKCLRSFRSKNKTFPRRLVIFSADNWSVQSPPKRIVCKPGSLGIRSNRSISSGYFCCGSHGVPNFLQDETSSNLQSNWWWEITLVGRQGFLLLMVEIRLTSWGW